MNKTIHVHPRDEYNQQLENNVHPQDWNNPQPAKGYNLVVIGAGTAGLVTAAGAAGLGAKVALVERALMGGDCLNWGCVPSKCIIRSARLWRDLKDTHALGLSISQEANYNFPTVMERMRRIRSHISEDDSVKRFQHLGVDVFLGQASFTGENTIDVEGTSLKFKKAVITTGTKALIPPIDGIESCDYLTNETIFTLTERPEHLAVVGGGPIGSELAQTFRRLGSRVTMIERSSRIMSKEDEDVSHHMQQVFTDEGIELHLNASLKKVQQNGNQKTLYIQHEDQENTIHADQVLIATGRTPNVADLGLEKVGVEYDTKKGVHVNDHLQTSHSKIYAAGDICMAHQFTHAADASARIVIRNTLFSFLPKQKVSSLIIPWSTYTDPEVAHVGLGEQEAKQQNIEYDVYTQKFEDVHRALADGEENGFTKILIEKGSDKILGATIVARHAGEMINEITLAMKNKIGLGNIASVIHPYPTQAESIKQAADAYNRTRLTPGLKKFLKWFLGWQVK